MELEIDHLGIAVRNLEEGLRFYQEILGMSTVGQETIKTERVNVAMLPIGQTSSPANIELLAATDSESAIAKFIEKRGPGLHHIALRVDDLTAAAERLRAQGCRLLDEPQIGAGGHRYVFVHPHSTGGVLLELVQK